MIGRIILSFTILIFRQYFFICKFCISRIRYDEIGEIQNFFQSSRRNVQHQSHTGRDPFKVPDVRYRGGQLDVTHPLSSYFCFRYFYTALIAYDAFVTNSFIFPAVTFPVLCRSKDPFTVQSVFFRFQSSVVDRLRFGNLSMRPAQDLFSRCQPDLQGLKIIQFIIVVIVHRSLPLSYKSSSSSDAASS